MDNIAEGFKRDGKRNLFNFFIFQKVRWTRQGHRFTVLLMPGIFQKRNLMN